MARSIGPLVIVISAWHDDDGTRARLVFSDGGVPQFGVYRSVGELLDRLGEAFEAWERSEL